MKLFWRWFPHKHLWRWCDRRRRVYCTRCGRDYADVTGDPWGSY